MVSAVNMEWEKDAKTLEEVDGAIVECLVGLVVPSGAEVKLFGHQPPANRDDKSAAQVYVWRSGPPRPADGVGTPAGTTRRVSKRDTDNKTEEHPEGVPLEYEIRRPSKQRDIIYEVRYIVRNEDDDRALAIQINNLFPDVGQQFFGPDGEGPFYVFATEVLPERQVNANELAGLIRLRVSGVCFDGELIRTVAAIGTVDVQTDATL